MCYSSLTFDLKTKSGYICATDKCTIMDVYSNGAVRVKYPVSGGRYKIAFARTNDFFNSADFAVSTTHLGKRLKAYKKSVGSSTIGTVYATDDVIIIGTENGRTQVMYPISGSNSWKMGWVPGKYDEETRQTITSVSEGYYIIKSAIDSSYVWDINCA